MWKASICQSDFLPPQSPAILSSYCLLTYASSQALIYFFFFCSSYSVFFLSSCLLILLALLFLRFSLASLNPLFSLNYPIASPHNASFPSALSPLICLSSYPFLSSSPIFFFLCLLLLLCFSLLLFAVSSTCLMGLASQILMPRLSGVVSCDRSFLIGGGLSPPARFGNRPRRG